MTIKDIDYKSGHILVLWYEETDTPYLLNHMIPEVLRENPQMSMEEVEALLELERPPKPELVYSSMDEVPEVLFHMMERDEPDVSMKREDAILSEWNVPQQLEALTEAAEDPPRAEKLNKLLAHIQSVKERYPKDVPS